MADDWIKMRINLDTDPAVVRISSALKTDRFTTVGRLHKIWSWANEHLTDGQDVPIDSEFLDSLVQAPGFSEQLRRVGWLSGRDGGLSFPGFDRHNGESAKKRAQDAARKRVRRMSAECPVEKRTKSGLEKRREEKSRGNKKHKYKSEDFERFWLAFPSGRKTSKAKAESAFKRCIRDTDPEVIIAAAAEYAASDVGKGQYVKGPEPWLNGGCWEDDRRAWNQGSSSPATSSAAQKTLEAAQRAHERLMNFE